VTAPPSTLVICCGAVAREILGLVRERAWEHIEVTCLPANFHNTPENLPEGIRAKIRANRKSYTNILVLYSDCGSGGRIQAVLDEEGVQGIGGAHCYEVFSGSENFRRMMAEEPGSFFLTDFLARHFEKLVFRGLGLDRFPQLRKKYFGKYKKVVYLAQSEDPELRKLAESAAVSVGLAFEMRQTGYGDFERFLATH